ncbi:cysteine-rich protein 2-binding protein isoform X1 [Hylaeus volcanicus]|uniref:cysteine-rich protein 2-binding protein isoform X1 n=1 Tax=Hylaeus volcanicus TaxID=313075 RepID=UPI0023B77CD6|nr:cysteine-rich protein 2-binding protein isoform X1 [Hylaeus volcanicus]
MVDSQNIAEKPVDFPETDVCKNCKCLSDPYNKPALRCNGCSKKIHIECLKRGTVPVSFVGDVFFEFYCHNCSPFDEETVARNRMPWLNVIVLTLYNLREKSSGISKRGYFHWKSDISTFVDRNWDYLFKKTVKRKKNWIGTISGTLSHYSGIFFKSGTTELGESGWWRLIDNDPPEVLIAKNEKMILDRKKQVGNQVKSTNQFHHSPTLSESRISVGEDCINGNDVVKTQGCSAYSEAYVQPNKTLLDFLLEEDELSNMEIEDNTILNEQSDTPSLSDLIRDCQYQTNGFHFSQLLDDFTSDWTSNTDVASETIANINIDRIKAEEEEDEDEDEDEEEEEEEEDENEEEEEDENEEEDKHREGSNKSPGSIQEQPPTSLFNVIKRRPWPWQRNHIIVEKVPRMTHQEETYLLQQINKSALNSAAPEIRRFYRKLTVRKLKREYGLPLLDIDHYGCKAEIPDRPLKEFGRVLDRFFGDDLSSFEQRLQGYNEPSSVHSPYTNRLLKPFIRRDTSCRPLWLRVMEELCTKANKLNPMWKLPATAPIDYSYVRPQHIPAINSLCSQFFWPGIDLTECLQYPDFSCVVLYKKLVIGFAILVPDVGYNEAYISFFLTRPEWRKSGIGTFMLYHLIQTCMGKDVTLHVSATNPALILYQKFGFKVEEFVQDFYDKYMPPNSRECRHALFLRLSR